MPMSDFCRPATCMYTVAGAILQAEAESIQYFLQAPCFTDALSLPVPEAWRMPMHPILVKVGCPECYLFQLVLL